MICDHCKKGIKTKVYRYLDGDNFNANDKGYVTICSGCAEKVLLDDAGNPVSRAYETALMAFDILDKEGR